MVGVRTVEHLLSALYALGVDNALLEISGAELPVLDGSAAPLLRSFCRVASRADCSGGAPGRP